MLTLFLDFCSHRKIIAVVRDGDTIVEKELADHTDEATVMPAVAECVHKAGSAFTKLERIAAVTGPGGFMSQRVGLSIANALSWSLKIPIGGLHLSDLYAMRVDGDALWIHSTKKQLLFIRGYGKYKAMWPEPVTITLDELQKVKEGSYVGEVLPEQAAVLHIKPLAAMKPISDVVPNVLETISYGKTALVPWYGRGA